MNFLHGISIHSDALSFHGFVSEIQEHVIATLPPHLSSSLVDKMREGRLRSIPRLLYSGGTFPIGTKRTNFPGASLVFTLDPPSDTL